MGRRSDHSRDELRDLLIACGQDLLAEVGFARFSGREVAKRAGYTVGTIYNVFGSLDHLIASINSRTFGLWAGHVSARMDARMEGGADDRIRVLVEAYFSFALENPQLWSAIYDHRLPDGMDLSDDDKARRAVLTDIVEQEVRTALPPQPAGGLDITRYARSLIAMVHGHCSYVVTGSFALLEEPDPVGSALARVRESLSCHGYVVPG